MKRMIAALAIAPMIAGCSVERGTDVTHLGSDRIVSVAAKGSWPFHGYEEIRAAVLSVLEEECSEPTAEPSEPSVTPAPLTYDELVGAIEERVPLHTYKWSGTCGEYRASNYSRTP